MSASFRITATIVTLLIVLTLSIYAMLQSTVEHCIRSAYPIQWTDQEIESATWATADSMLLSAHPRGDVKLSERVELAGRYRTRYVAERDRVRSRLPRLLLVFFDPSRTGDDNLTFLVVSVLVLVPGFILAGRLMPRDRHFLVGYESGPTRGSRGEPVSGLDPSLSAGPPQLVLAALDPALLGSVVARAQAREIGKTLRVVFDEQRLMYESYAATCTAAGKAYEAQERIKNAPLHADVERFELERRMRPDYCPLLAEKFGRKRGQS